MRRDQMLEGLTKDADKPMSTLANVVEARVAVLVDCDNVSPEILEHALRVVAQFGRVVLRRGYGNQGTLAHRWQDALVRLAFSPQTYGHSGLLSMVKSYDLLLPRQEEGGHWWVSLAPKATDAPAD